MTPLGKLVATYAIANAVGLVAAALVHALHIID